ncbi:hypothetical protein [Roseiterribacter gracilis]|uniref:Uncharacterized protein n=1 Tax=Roseiterribacter gracilis TaxID=2812848 RepID=A0A8S8XGT3_9PROT|nr:hypothetical protein TMPK1_29240 [Rhodospirillales bacterium TMPK1]
MTTTEECLPATKFVVFTMRTVDYEAVALDAACMETEFGIPEHETIRGFLRLGLGLVLDGKASLHASVAAPLDDCIAISCALASDDYRTMELLLEVRGGTMQDLAYELTAIGHLAGDS